MISYQPALDRYHSIFRIACLLRGIPDSYLVDIDKLRILDFYAAFPFRLQDFKFKRAQVGLKKVGRKYDYIRPYGGIPDDQSLFLRMKPIQALAMDTLAAHDMIDRRGYQDGAVIPGDEQLPAEIVERADEYVTSNDDLVSTLRKLAVDYPLLGEDGLKRRSASWTTDMTLFEPTLIVERMLVQKDGRTAYDERFHDGVNVIRGDNSSGKSTILNFIFYGLGGDLQDWGEAALRCTHVYVQARLNNDVVTFARGVTDKPRPPMDIFAGEIDPALTAPASQWNRFGYTRSDKRESFSQVIFRLLNMPEVANETSGNLTINQLLRLLYADQLSPVGNLFKSRR